MKRVHHLGQNRTLCFKRLDKGTNPYMLQNSFQDLAQQKASIGRNVLTVDLVGCQVNQNGESQFVVRQIGHTSMQ